MFLGDFMGIENARIKFIESFIESLLVERKEYEDSVNLANKMIKFQKYITLIMLIVGFCFGGLTNSSSFIVSSLSGGFHGFLISIPISLFSYLYWGIVRKKYNNKISYIDANIENALEMKRSIESEILKENNREINSSRVCYDVVLEQENVNHLECEKPKKKVRKLNFKKKK